MSRKRGKKNKSEGYTRIAVVDPQRCKPKKCNLECKIYCPVNIIGKVCIEVKKTDKKTKISEIMCQGCGICPKKCPFKAIQIINLPKSLESETTHRFGQNGFKLHRLPLPRPNTVLGLVGTNGIGKTTALHILSGKMKPNLGLWEEKPTWDDILKHFRGTEHQSYFSRVVEDKLTVSNKPQYVDLFMKEARRLKRGFSVKKFLAKNDELDKGMELAKELQLEKLMDRNVSDLSGGELQRLICLKTAISDSDIYMFDEPSSYLDVSQRLSVSNVIRKCLYTDKKYVIVVEHDLAILDFLSDFICVLFGKAGAYGIVSTPFGVREGINIFLSGFIPTENVRFRNFQLDFKLSQTQYAQKNSKRMKNKKGNYPALKKTFFNKDNKTKKAFEMEVEEGDFSNSEIIVLLGENGTGKSTLIKMLAGKLPSDDEDADIPELGISFKPQTITPKFKGTVRQLFMKKIKDSFLHPQFQTDVYKPLDIDHLLDRKVKQLSGGELQRVALCLALGVQADVYFLDEPSAYLDALQRIKCAKVIKRYIFHTKKTAFIVEHDFIMATYLADRVIVFDGEPGVKCRALAPQDLLTGMNMFLKMLNITFRRDPRNFRPRINKLNSVKDREQKHAGNFFFQNVGGKKEEDRLQTYFKKVGKKKAEKDAAKDKKKEEKRKQKEKEKRKEKQKKEEAVKEKKIEEEKED